jgi:alanine-synthesizing transaminase
LTSLEFSRLLLQKAHVAVSPGSGFGRSGEGYVRFSLVENEQRIRQAVRNIRKLLGAETHGQSKRATAEPVAK